MSRKILIVEDERAIAQLYKLKLDLCGYETDVAENGLQALHKINRYIPDLILLDLSMPVMNGEEFLKKFRQIKQLSDIPVIVLTNISREEAPRTLWHYGISNYFVKAHHTPADLVEYIETTLEEANDKTVQK